MEIQQAIAKIQATEAGKEFFSYLKRAYVDRKIFDQDPIVMTQKVACSDLVNGLILIGENKDVHSIKRKENVRKTRTR